MIALNIAIARMMNPYIENVTYKIIEERNNEMRYLENELEQIAEIQTDLAFLVHCQGDDIATIEQHVENAVINVDEGTKSIAQAEVYQTKSRRKSILLGGIITAVCVAVGGGLIIPLSAIAGGITMGCGIVAGTGFIIAAVKGKK
jgi:hypothetical protein